MRQFKKWTPLPRMMIKCSCRDGMHSKTLVSIIWIISLSKIKMPIHIKSNFGRCTSLLQRSGLLFKEHWLRIISILSLSTCLTWKKLTKSSIPLQSLLTTLILSSNQKMDLPINLKSSSLILMADKLHIIWGMQEMLERILCTFQFLSNLHICLRRTKKWNTNLSLIMIQLTQTFLNAIQDCWLMKLILNKSCSMEKRISSRTNQRCYSFQWTATIYEENITETWTQKIETTKNRESSQY